MKRKFSFSNKGTRRSIGQTVAVTVMALVVTFSGVGTTALLISQPAGLTVASSANTKQEAWLVQEEPDTALEDETESTLPPAEETETEASAPTEQATDTEPDEQEASSVPATQQQQTVEQTVTEQSTAAGETAQAETQPAQNSGDKKKVDITEGNIEEENTTYAVFQPETPELAAEDPLSPPAEAEDTSAATTEAERAAQAMEEDPVLLTPEQIEQALEEGALAEGQTFDPTDENCLKWIWDWIVDSLFAKDTYSGWHTDSSGRTYYYDTSTHEAYTGIHSINGVLYYFNENGVKQDVTFGIDVSKYQTNIDWNKVKTSGVEFVIIRLGYRGYSTGTLVEDPMFESHYSGASKAGLRIGVYAFSQAINENEAREEAQACVYVLDGRKLDYPIYFDTEASGATNGSGRADGLGVTDRTKCAVAFCEEVESLGYEAGVYASSRWFTKRLDMSALSGYSIWNAHYDVVSSDIACDLWQGSCEGRINGYSGSIDVNISYIG